MDAPCPSSAGAVDGISALQLPSVVAVECSEPDGVRGVARAVGWSAFASATGVRVVEGRLRAEYVPRLGQVAQLVEQRTEIPRVGGSIPSLAIGAKAL